VGEYVLHWRPTGELAGIDWWWTFSYIRHVLLKRPNSSPCRLALNSEAQPAIVVNKKNTPYGQRWDRFALREIWHSTAFFGYDVFVFGTRLCCAGGEKIKQENMVFSKDSNVCAGSLIGTGSSWDAPKMKQGSQRRLLMRTQKIPVQLSLSVPSWRMEEKRYRSAFSNFGTR
jgi:hypothetical protein